MNGSIADNIGRKVEVIFIGESTYRPAACEVWLLEADSIPGDGGYRDIYYIVRWRGDVETGRWNLFQLTGWNYLGDGKSE